MVLFVISQHKNYTALQAIKDLQADGETHTKIDFFPHLPLEGRTGRKCRGLKPKLNQTRTNCPKAKINCYRK